jgi:hypothetical protein
VEGPEPERRRRRRRGGTLGVAGQGLLREGSPFFRLGSNLIDVELVKFSKWFRRVVSGDISFAKGSDLSKDTSFLLFYSNLSENWLATV